MWCFVKFVLPRSCLDRENTSLSLTFLFGQLLWASLPKFFGRIWQHFPPLVSTLEYFANCTLRDVWSLLWNRNSATLVTGLATATTVTIATVSKRRISERITSSVTEEVTKETASGSYFAVRQIHKTFFSDICWMSLLLKPKMVSWISFMAAKFFFLLWTSRSTHLFNW